MEVSRGPPVLSVEDVDDLVVLEDLDGLGLLGARVADHGGRQEVGGDGPAVGLVNPARHLLSELLKHPPWSVRSVTEQQARPVD